MNKKPEKHTENALNLLFSEFWPTMYFVRRPRQGPHIIQNPKITKKQPKMSKKSPKFRNISQKMPSKIIKMTQTKIFQTDDLKIILSGPL